jgi:CubicO group peptidase (beta-lactamase class C family)
VRRFGFLIGALIGVAVFEQPSSAQSPVLDYALFEGSLEGLRVEAGIPAISAAIVQDGRVAWSAGKGKVDVEANIAARPDSPYVVGSLAQTLGSTLLLRRCMDQSYLELGDTITRWTPTYPETSTSIRDLLTHTGLDGVFRYAPARLSALKGVVEECAYGRYPQLLAQQLFELLGMLSSVPGQTLGTPTPDEASLFDPARLSRYADILRRVAVPYRVISRRPSRNTDLLPARLDFAQGVVSTALDLALFDIAYDSGFLSEETRRLSLSQAFANGRPLPTGLGWFVQAYNGEAIAWQFGVIENGYSSLIVKVPNRKLTLILLANSDGLAAPFALENGDVTASLFARIFLKTFLP